MKKFIFIIVALLSLILVGCGKKSEKSTSDKLYFDYTGIAEVKNIAYTKESSFDLKTIFKVGTKTSALNNKKLGETTYDDIYYYIYDYTNSNNDTTENDDVKINSNGIVERKRLCTVVIYAALKNEVNFTEDDKANGSMHVLTLFFGNEKTFGTWVADNPYLDIWIENKKNNGETNAKKATITLVFKEDFTYTITITDGYYGTSSTEFKIKSQTITGHLYGSISSGAERLDDETDEYQNFKIEMNKYSLIDDEEYTLFTSFYLTENSSIGTTVRFLPQ